MSPPCGGSTAREDPHVSGESPDCCVTSVVEDVALEPEPTRTLKVNVRCAPVFFGIVTTSLAEPEPHGSIWGRPASVWRHREMTDRGVLRPDGDGDQLSRAVDGRRRRRERRDARDGSGARARGQRGQREGRGEDREHAHEKARGETSAHGGSFVVRHRQSLPVLRVSLGSCVVVRRRWWRAPPPERGVRRSRAG